MVRYLIGRKERWVSAFTLIELMIVVSIIGILASIAIPKFADLIRKSKEGATKGGLGAMRSALSIYSADMEGQFPYDLSSLTINGKYLTAIPMLRLPYYHPDENVAVGNSCHAPCDIIASTAQTSEMFGGQLLPFAPVWFTENVANPGDDATNFGNVWISCTHTDSRGTIWTSY